MWNSKYNNVKHRSWDKYDCSYDAVLCKKCGKKFYDLEPFGCVPEFWHTIDPKRYCPNQGSHLRPGMIGVEFFRRKKDRRARHRGAKKAGKLFRKSKKS